jgi:hypothetical protein
MLQSHGKLFTGTIKMYLHLLGSNLPETTLAYYIVIKSSGKEKKSFLIWTQGSSSRFGGQSSQLGNTFIGINFYFSPPWAVYHNFFNQ